MGRASPLPPGREECRGALGPGGRYGKWICDLPAAVQLGRIVFSHAGILPDWAHDGIDGLNDLVGREMRQRAYFPDFPESSPLIDPEGPLWTRAYARGAKWVRGALMEVLGRFSASSMVVGHTPNRNARVRARYSRRVVCIDTGIGRVGVGRLSALLVEKDAFWALYPRTAPRGRAAAIRVRIGGVPKAVKPHARPGRPRAALHAKGL